MGIGVQPPDLLSWPNCIILILYDAVSAKQSGLCDENTGEEPG
ncbi:hypothetical protein [Luxibacter massiliensis]|nr:hypothetical protein [Luxibacter massiliensis]